MGQGAYVCCRMKLIKEWHRYYPIQVNQVAAGCFYFILSTHIIHNLRLALLHIIIFATYLKSWHSQKKLTNFISARVTHQGTNNSLSWRPTCLHCRLAWGVFLGAGRTAGCALRVGGHLCELSFVRFISHKQIWGVVYLYRKRANNAPGTRRSRVLNMLNNLPDAAAVAIVVAAATCVAHSSYFLSCFFSSTNYVAKKIYLTFPLQ